MICKSKTEFLSRLDLGQSLNSILMIKMRFPEQLQSHYLWKPDAKLLKSVYQPVKSITTLIPVKKTDVTCESTTA